ncbi:AraC family transcriptional regulator [Gammaproteobacteria bacterium]|nr:AraC family transcriptional regulator [Gammaproteobacteria bacterium]
MPEPIFSFLSILFLLGAAQAVFLSLALLTVKKGNRQANRYLSALLVLFAADLLNEFLDISLYGLHVIELMFVLFPTDYLYGPFIWLYVLRITGQNKLPFGVPLAWHFVPFFIHFSTIWSNYPQAKDPLLLVKFPELQQGNQIEPWMMNETLGMLAVVHMALYLGLGLILLKQFASDIGNNFSYTEGVGLQWLRRLLVILLLLYVLYALRFLIAPVFEFAEYADTMLNLGFVITIYSLGYFGLQQPAIFVLLKSHEVLEFGSDMQTVESKNDFPNSTSSNIEVEKYAKSSLTLEKANAIVRQLKTCMEESMPYLDNKLNLIQLSRLLDISPNHLSQVINEQLSLNFFDFVNSYRIEAAKRQLMEMDPKQYTILGLALDSGFNSKSAFYTGFKKHTRMTPTAFRSAHFES